MIPKAICDQVDPNPIPHARFIVRVFGTHQRAGQPETLAMALRDFTSFIDRYGEDDIVDILVERQSSKDYTPYWQIIAYLDDGILLDHPELGI